MSASAAAVEAIFIAAESGQLPHPVAEVEALSGRGLRGDRKCLGEGTFSDDAKRGRDLTLIEAEAIEALEAEEGIALEPAASRRNVLTRGIALNDLVGERFRVGKVECIGVELCEPCSRLESLTEPGVLRGLVHRGGLRADILTGGTITIGDPVEPLPTLAG
jgi:MOSC domain-containing protein YiiM